MAEKIIELWLDWWIIQPWQWLPEGTRPGNLLQLAIENGPVEIVDLPIKIVIFHSYVSLPEGSLRVLTRQVCFRRPNDIWSRAYGGLSQQEHSSYEAHADIHQTKLIQQWFAFLNSPRTVSLTKRKKTTVFSTYTHTHHDGPTNGFFRNWNEDFVGPIWICHMTSKRRWAATDKWLSGRTGLTHKLCSLQTLNGVWSSALNFQVNDQSICCRRREVQLDS